MFLYWILLSLGSISLVLTHDCEDFKGIDVISFPGQIKPKIQISLTPNNDQIEYIDANRTQIRIHGGNESKVHLKCIYPSPVELRRGSAHLSIPDAKVEKRRFAKDPSNNSSYCYTVELTVPASEQITGEYRCIDQKALKNNIYSFSKLYIYKSDEKFVVLTRGQKLKVFFSELQPWVLIPCPVSDPDHPVRLYLDVNGNLEEFQRETSKVEYNPEIGFRVRTPVVRPNGGTFRCAGTHPYDFVEVLLQIEPVPYPNVIAEPPFKNLTVYDGERLYVSCEAKSPTIFHVSNPIVEQAKYEDTQDQVPIPNEQGLIVSSYQSEPLEIGTDGNISCIDKDTNTILHEWYFKTLPITGAKHGSFLQKFGPTLKDYECELKDGTSKVAVTSCNSDSECEMKRCVRKDRTCKLVKSFGDLTGKHPKSGIMQCFGEDDEELVWRWFLTDIKDRKRTAFPFSLKNDGLEGYIKITQYNKKGADTQFICSGWPMAFDAGFKWYADLHGNLTVLEGASERIYENLIESIVTVNLEKLESRKLVCKAPITGSFDWTFASFDVRKNDAANLVSLKILNIFIGFTVILSLS